MIHSKKTWQLGFVVVLACSISARALVFSAEQDNFLLDDETEIWVATLDIEVMKLRLQLMIDFDENGQAKGRLLSPDQTSSEIELDEVTRTAESLGFKIRRSNASFEGTIDTSGQIASGTYTQQNSKFPLEFRKLDGQLTRIHEATWAARYQAIGREHRCQVRVFRDSDGMQTALLDIFSDGVFGLPCEFEMEDGKATLTCRILKIEFKGELDPTGQQLSGQWNQDGLVLPFRFVNTPVSETAAPILSRPQTPQPPFPYQVQQFQLPLGRIDQRYEPDVVIAGTVSSPEGDGPFPTVLLIGGVGGQDRDLSFLGHQPGAVIADHLTRRGYAVVRYDDRGVGESRGQTTNAAMINYTNDAEAILRWIKTLSIVDPQRIIIIGRSEGTAMASRLAMRQPDLAGIIMLAGQGLPGKKILMSQTEAMAQAHGLPADFIERQLAFTSKMIELGQSEQQFSLIDVQELSDEHFGNYSDIEKFNLGIHRIVEANFRLMQTPKMRFFLSYDPRTTLAYTRCPVLAIYGELDRQMLPEENIPEIQRAIKAGGNDDFTAIVLPGLNHNFQPTNSGASAEYIDIKVTIDDSALQVITEWLDQRFK